jgi:cation diffusion facilitator family transporter
MQEGSRRAIVAAFLANLGIAIAKFVGFAITGAASLLAEALHSVADTGNQALLFLGGARARRRPTPEHPFGYGRERYFWAFVVALMLFSLGGLFAVYEGIDKLLHPHQLESVAIALAVLSVAIVLESLSFRTAFVEAAAVKGEESWWSFIRRSKSPELPVVLLEDTGALLGLGLAFVGVSLAEVTGNPRWDAVGSIGIGILLVVIAIVLAAEMKSLLIGESATAQTESAIRAAIGDGPEVRRIIHLRTLHLGPDELLVAAKVELDSPSVLT